jgi:hypothetical protein
VSLAESGGTVRCAACSQEAAWGLLFLHPFAQAFAGVDGVSPLCAPCFYRKHESSEIVVAHARDWRLTGGSVEDRFEALLEAARVFWRAWVEGVPREIDEVFPTLRLAHKIGEQGMRTFIYHGVRLSDVLEGVPVLAHTPEHTPVCVSSPQTTLTAPVQSFLIIQIGAHRQPIKPDEIAEAYKEGLEAVGEPWGGKGSCILCAFHGDELYVEVKRGAYSTQDDGSLWPSPPTVGRMVRGALEEFAGELQLRKRGPDPKPENLIPATVAHLLRATALENPFTTNAGKTDRQKIQRLLERRVFCEEHCKELPAISPTRWGQIWRDVPKIAKMEDLYGPGPMRHAVFRRS